MFCWRSFFVSEQNYNSIFILYVNIKYRMVKKNILEINNRYIRRRKKSVNKFANVKDFIRIRENAFLLLE